MERCEFGCVWGWRGIGEKGIGGGGEEVICWEEGIGLELGLFEWSVKGWIEYFLVIVNENLVMKNGFCIL